MDLSFSSDPIRLGVIGGNRGASLARAAGMMPDQADVVAICDHDEAVRDRWVAARAGLRGYRKYDELLADEAIDAVIIATPWSLHQQQAIAALAAGKHVFSEVLACSTVDEGLELIDAVDRSGLVYMMGENSCYTRTNLVVQNLAGQGRFGTLTYLRGAYLHDTRYLLHEPDGRLTWRGDGRHENADISYPTHALGPLMHWVAAANGADDLPARLTAVKTPSAAVSSYFEHTFGTDHPGASPEFWRSGDGGSVLITTASGTVVDVRVDGNSPRPGSSHTTYHELQGSKGLFLGSRGQGDPGLVWFEEPGRTVTHDHSGEATDGFVPIDSLFAEYEHPLWHKWFGDQDFVEGHYGGDFVVIERFIAAIRGETPPPVDVRAAVAWSIVTDLSARSIAAGGATVEFPAL